jgi:hypothetical protein
MAKKKPAKAGAKRQRPKDLTARKAKAVKGGASDLQVTKTVNKASPVLF